MKKNYQKEMEDTIARLHQAGRVPKLLLHSCCAPCSSAVLERLSGEFHITVFYYNPNIWPAEEYEKRVAEQEELIRRFPAVHPISFLAGPYDTERFYQMAKGKETLPEGGERCFDCYKLRLQKTAETAKAADFDYFTTTLSISPLKNAEKLNEIGGEIAQAVGVEYLYSDFKKRDGYKRSIELSREYGLYRQNYCGCVYSYQQVSEASKVTCREAAL